MSTTSQEKRSRQFKHVGEVIDLIPAMKKMPVVEVGEMLAELAEDHLVEILDRFSPSEQGFILAEFPMDKQLAFFRHVSKKRFALIFEHMSSEYRVDLFQHLTPREQAGLLPYLSKVVREDVMALNAYPPDTAGGIMSTDFATVQEDMSCAEAIAKVRIDAPSKRTIYYIYVVNDNQELQGFITLKSLIMNEPETLVSQAMHREFAFARADEDREEVARLIEKYDLVALPVVNHKNQLVGIVTHDEAIDVIRAEHTEDMEKFMGIVQTQEEFDYMKTSTWQHFRKRVVWLVSLAALGIISGIIIHQYESALEQLLILALYMPMMADTGGNSGSQAATVIIRALALGQVTIAHWLRIIWKEVRVALLLSVCLGLLAYAKVLFLSWETEIPAVYSLGKIAFVIALALALQVISSTIIGAGLPLIVKRLGGDPALVASPAITTVVDVTGLLIYFGMATAFFNL
ncbi:MAG TPA: magnesium transporter [Saprospiraceae bacterium]|nr:magnesium transporter [Saprospiraceae bacterium]HMP25545.1 magnesium transporter [Saprospiraceae bacterium]